MSSNFIVGLDLAQSSDFTAWSVAEQVPVPMGKVEITGVRWVAENYGPPKAVPVERPVTRDDYHVRHLERCRGVAYPRVVARTRELVTDLEAAGHSVMLVVDQTGVGAAVVDLLREAGLGPTGVMITGGQQASLGADSAYTVPKRDLVMNLVVLLQTGRLKIAKDLSEADTLLQELLNFRVKISASGHDAYGAGAAPEWREGAHDDLVLATAIACWVAETGSARAPWGLFTQGGIDIVVR